MVVCRAGGYTSCAQVEKCCFGRVRLVAQQGRVVERTGGTRHAQLLLQIVCSWIQCQISFVYVCRPRTLLQVIPRRLYRILHPPPFPKNSRLLERAKFVVAPNVASFPFTSNFTCGTQRLLDSSLVFVGRAYPYLVTDRSPRIHVDTSLACRQQFPFPSIV